MPGKIRFVAVLTCAAALFSVSSQATPIGVLQAPPIIGELNIFGDVAVGATTIDWLPAGGGTGTIMVSASSTGSFAPLIGSTGTQKDLNVAIQPVGSPFSLGDYITLPGGISLELQMIHAGVFGSGACGAAPAAGQNCTPAFPAPSSPFNLTNTLVGSTASFTVSGVGYQDGELVSLFVGTYTTQFTGRNYQSLLNTIGSGSTVNASYSANFVVTQIPEPSTAFLVIGGLFLTAGGVLSRRLRRRA